MNVLAAIKREERKLEKQLGRLQRRLDSVRSSTSLWHSAGREVTVVKKRGARIRCTSAKLARTLQSANCPSQ
jgi:hypothetical protein